jgi:hypothetical protein
MSVEILNSLQMDDTNLKAYYRFESGLSLDENFDSYNDGDLVGQGGWYLGSSGDGLLYDIQTSVKQAGAKAVAITTPANTTYNSIIKDVTPFKDKRITCYVMRPTVTATEGYSRFQILGGSSTVFYIVWRTSVTFTGDSAEVIGTAAANTWYKLEIDVRASDGYGRARFNGGTWSSWIAPIASYSFINKVSFSCRGDSAANTTYFDTLSIGDYLTMDSSGNGHDLIDEGTIIPDASGKFGGAAAFGGAEQVDQTLGDTSSSAAFLTNYWRAQAFTLGKGNVTFIGLQLKKRGSPTGNITFEIQSDNAGAPSGTVLRTTTLNSATLTTSYAEYRISLSTQLTPGTKYHICMKGQAAWDSTNDVDWGYLAGTGFAQYNYGPGDFSLNATTVQQSVVIYYGDFYSITDHADLKPDGVFTVGGWFKSSTDAAQLIFQSYSQNPNRAGILLYGCQATTGVAIFNTGKNTGTVIGTDAQSVTGTTNLIDGAYHFVVGTWDGSYLRLYVDAVQEGGDVAWAYAPAYATPNYPGLGIRRNIEPSNHLTGSLDDTFLLKGTVLSGAQISYLYDMYATRVSAGEFSLSGVSMATIHGYFSELLSAGAFILSGNDSLFSKGYQMIAAVGEFTLTGVNIAVNRGYNMFASVGSFILTGISIGIRTSGQVANEIFGKITDIKFGGKIISNKEQAKIDDINFNGKIK